MPNPEWLINTNFEPRTAEEKAPKSIHGMFTDDEEKVFKIRGLTLNEICRRDEEVTAIRTDHFKNLIASAFQAGEGGGLAVAEEALSYYFGDSNSMRAVTIHHIANCVQGCTYPKMARNHWQKLGKIAPKFVEKLSNKIDRMTGEGASPGE